VRPGARGVSGWATGRPLRVKVPGAGTDRRSMGDPDFPLDLLACPACGDPLELGPAGLACAGCATAYGRAAGGPWDLRLRGPKGVTVEHVVGRALLPAGAPPPDFGPLAPHPQPAFAFDPAELPTHLSPAMASHLPTPSRDGAACLDLGCGGGAYRAPLERLGYRWCGVDFSNPRAPLWGDVHALPFRDGAFELVVSLAVLEHVQFPSVALREVARVLEPGGTFFGSVAYLVPFHSQSFYNMTHLGAYSALADAGFRVGFVAADPVYLGIRALAYTGMFLGRSRRLAYAVVEPIVRLQKAWWAWKRRRGSRAHSRERESQLTTGAFVFAATKPP